MEVIVAILFVSILICMLTGYPVAFVLGGVSAIVGLMFVPDFLDFLPLRIMGVLQNNLLMAVPMFIMMGLVMEKTGIAEELLISLGNLMKGVPGGLAIAVVIVGGILAASTGIVGATVITMGLISLPVMQKAGYPATLSTGIIAASGTLGQIIPPSVVLVLLGSVLQVPVGDLFLASVFPGLLLMVLYGIYVIFKSGKVLVKNDTQKIDTEINQSQSSVQAFFLSVFFPLLLILLVLGSIFMGIASPTEASGLGAMGAFVMAAVKKKFSMDLLNKVASETVQLTTMVFFILLGATTFALVFRGLGGDDMLTSLVTASQLTAFQFLILVMVLVFIAGFFIDFIEIIFIIVPVVAPIFVMYKIDLVWLGVLLAINLQTSFLTPPFGFALFYLKGVLPDGISTKDMYKGVMPFIIIQVLVFILFLLFPSLIMY